LLDHPSFQEVESLNYKLGRNKLYSNRVEIFFQN
jgi:hypothetical protein